MNVPLVEAPSPEEKNNYPQYPVPLNTGNVRDDDATVMDDMLQENTNPGTPFPTAIAELHPTAPVVATRLITGSMTFLQSPVNPNIPYRILAADPRRVDLKLFVSVKTPAVGYAPVFFASDGGSFLTDSTAAAINAGANGYSAELKDHTGEVWAYYPSSGFATDVIVSWIATTK